MKLTKNQARRFLLAHQFLLPPYNLHGKPGILEIIQRLGCIQFDPLNITGQNPELVLQSRIQGFRPALLQELLYKDRLLLDGLDKNMSIYAVEDWPYFERFRKQVQRAPGKESQPILEVVPKIREALVSRGPLSSIDLDIDGQIDYWWAPTRLARAAIESMYFWGELVIHHKVNSRKVYDFAANLLPAELLAVPDPNPTTEQFHDWRVLRRTGGMGLVWNRAGEAWLMMNSMKASDRQASLERLVQQGKLLDLEVEGIALPFYMRSQDLPTLNSVLSVDSLPQDEQKAAIIAPLDNLLWDRRLLKELFDFEYRWEVYKPAAQRQYGYYVLPVLYGDRFIARIEPVFEKKTRTLIIKNWWWEPGVEQSAALADGLRHMFAHFQAYLGSKALRLEEPAIELTPYFA